MKKKVLSSKTLLHTLFMKYRKYLPRKVRLMIAELHFKIYGRRMPWSLIRFEVHLTDRCNLNCAGCMHFSSLCRETNLLDIAAFEKDCRRLSELTDGKTSGVRLLGGEPLLHPRINDFLVMTRKYFHEINKSNETGLIELVTNGILLHEQSDKFWNVCKDNDIRIVISDYPVKIKADIIREKVIKFNVELKMHKEKISLRLGGSANQWAKLPIDIAGSHDYKKSFGRCPFAGGCFQLLNGKIFKCARIAYIDYFNAAFGTQLKVDGNDYVDIYRVGSVDEILYLLTTPAPFCRYCDVGNITWNNQWSVSKRLIDEYL